MPIDSHPNVFRFDGRLWVSELPGAEASAQLAEQRAWDSAHLKSQRWMPAVIVGALLGTALTLGLGTWGGIAPAIYLVLLPIGFGAGAVLGAVVNKRLLGDRLTDVPPTFRPTTVELTRVPSSVARRADEHTPVDDLIAWSKKGFVPKE